MTATRMPTLGRAATLAVLAGVWTAAAYLLWTSSVVPDLTLPHLDAHRYFSARTLRRVDAFDRFERWNFVLSQLALLGAFAYYARRRTRFTKESAAARIGAGVLLGLLGFVLAWLVRLPFQAADFWWQRRHGLVQGNVFGSIFGNWLWLAGTLLLLCLAVALVMGLAELLGRSWWLAAGPVFVGLAALYLFISPYLTGGLARLQDRRLADQAKAIASKEGVGDVPVRVEKVSDHARTANAYAFGLGPSRRVVLWDTLLAGGFTNGEVRVVIAHEYGHQARNHLPKGLAWFALLAIPSAFLIELSTRRRGGLGQPAAIPLALLVLVVIQVASTPLQNAISRHVEAEADWMALRTVRDPASAERLFAHFTRTNLVEPRDPTWAYLLLDTHPTTLQRIAMVEAWRALQQRASVTP